MNKMALLGEGFHVDGFWGCFYCLAYMKALNSKSVPWILGNPSAVSLVFVTGLKEVEQGGASRVARHESRS